MTKSDDSTSFESVDEDTLQFDSSDSEGDVFTRGL